MHLKRQFNCNDQRPLHFPIGQIIGNENVIRFVHLQFHMHPKLIERYIQNIHTFTPNGSKHNLYEFDS